MNIEGNWEKISKIEKKVDGNRGKSWKPEGNRKESRNNSRKPREIHRKLLNCQKFPFLNFFLIAVINTTTAPFLHHCYCHIKSITNWLLIILNTLNNWLSKETGVTKCDVSISLKATNVFIKTRTGPVLRIEALQC